MPFSFPIERDSLIISPLDAESFAAFRPISSWEERQQRLGATSMQAPEYTIGLQDPEIIEDVGHYAARLRGPLSILQNRVKIKNALIEHVTTEVGVVSPVFTGRSGNEVLYEGQAPLVPEDGRIWATTPEVWHGCIGESFNNPFNYTYRMARDYQAPAERPGEPFAPMIAALDTDKLEPAEGNLCDRTSWQGKDGASVLDAFAAVYYFIPDDLSIL